MVVISSMKCHGAIHNFVLFFQFVYRALIFGWLKGPKLWGVLFSLFFFKLFNELYKPCGLNRIKFLKKQTNKDNSPTFEELALGKAVFFGVWPWDQWCQHYQEWLEMKILRLHPDLLNLKLQEWNSVICLESVSYCKRQVNKWFNVPGNAECPEEDKVGKEKKGYSFAQRGQGVLF